MNNRLSGLNKELCIRCRNEYYSDVRQPWSERDDLLWGNGIVWCPHKYAEGDKERPPKKCPYSLEHIMAMQERIVR